MIVRVEHIPDRFIGYRFDFRQALSCPPRKISVDHQRKIFEDDESQIGGLTLFAISRKNVNTGCNLPETWFLKLSKRGWQTGRQKHGSSQKCEHEPEGFSFRHIDTVAGRQFRRMNIGHAHLAGAYLSFPSAITKYDAVRAPVFFHP